MPSKHSNDQNSTISHNTVRYHEIAIRSGCSNQRHGSRHVASTEKGEVGNTRSACSRDLLTPCARLLQQAESDWRSTSAQRRGLKEIKREEYLNGWNFAQKVTQNEFVRKSYLSDLEKFNDTFVKAAVSHQSSKRSSATWLTPNGESS